VGGVLELIQNGLESVIWFGTTVGFRAFAIVLLLSALNRADHSEQIVSALTIGTAEIGALKFQMSAKESADKIIFLNKSFIFYSLINGVFDGIEGFIHLLREDLVRCDHEAQRIVLARRKGFKHVFLTAEEGNELFMDILPGRWHFYQGQDVSRILELARGIGEVLGGRNIPGIIRSGGIEAVLDQTVYEHQI
jgi:hypothetical protein